MDVILQRLGIYGVILLVWAVVWFIMWAASSAKRAPAGPSFQVGFISILGWIAAIFWPVLYVL